MLNHVQYKAFELVVEVGARDLQDRVPAAVQEHAENEKGCSLIAIQETVI